MDLKDTIAKWHAAMCFLEEEDDMEQAVSLLLCIKQPSAKIFHNIGCIRMSQCLYTDAIQYFSSSLERDKYLALSYFLRGVCYHKSQRYDRAELDFLTAHSMAPPDGINYRQLGANFILDISHVADCLRVTRETFTGKNPRQVPACDSKACLFWPPKKMVDNLTKQDFLGKAKVISSTAETDIIYAADKRANLSPLPPKNRHASTLPTALPRQSRVIITPGGAEIVVPPQPRRPPPALPRTSGDPVIGSNGPKSRLRREKSKSAENLLDGSWESEGSLSSSHSGSRLNLRPDQTARLHTVSASSYQPRSGHTHTLPGKKSSPARSHLSSILPARETSSPMQERLPSSAFQPTPPPKPQASHPGVKGSGFEPQNSVAVEETSGRKTVKELAKSLSPPVCLPKTVVSTEISSKPFKPVRPPPPRVKKL